MSVYADILSAVKAKLDAHADFVTHSVDTVIRDRPFCSTDHGDVLPLSCIAPEKEILRQVYYANGVHIAYPVILAIFTEKSGAIQDATAREKVFDLREAARTTLHKPTLTGASTVFGSEYDPDATYDWQGLDNLFDISLQLFVFYSNEVRSV